MSIPELLNSSAYTNLLTGHLGRFLLLRMYPPGEGSRRMSKDYKSRLEQNRSVLSKEELSESLAGLDLETYQDCRRNSDGVWAEWIWTPMLLLARSKKGALSRLTT